MLVKDKDILLKINSILLDFCLLPANLRKDFAGFLIYKRSYTAPTSMQSRTILTRRQEAATEGQKYVFPKQGTWNKHAHLMLRADNLKNKTGLDLSVHGLRRSFIATG